MKTFEKLPLTWVETSSWAMNDILTPKYMVNMAAQADATALWELRQKASREGRQPPSYTALVMKAAALTMKRQPHANRAVLGFPFFKRLVQFHNIDVGVAVEKSLPSMPGHAYAEPIRDTLTKSLDDITRELHDLGGCDETNNAGYRLYRQILRLVPWPFSVWVINMPHWVPSLWVKHRGCACWVNAPSKAGADMVFTSWPWPITFSFGVVKKRPVAVGDEVKAQLTMPIMMVFDRRVMGGGPAGRVMADFKRCLESGLADEPSEPPDEAHDQPDLAITRTAHCRAES